MLPMSIVRDANVRHRSCATYGVSTDHLSIVISLMDCALLRKFETSVSALTLTIRAGMTERLADEKGHTRK